MARTTEIKVGVTILAAVGILLWGVTWLKDLSLTKKVQVWHVRFTQTGGLGPSDEVQVNGMRKGAVQSVALVGDHVIVDLGLDRDIHLTTDSRVAIRNVGLMGEKVIAVDLSLSGRPYTDRDTIAGTFELGMGEVMASAGGSIDALNQLTTRLQSAADMLGPKGEFGETMRNLRDTSKELSAAVTENRATLKSTLENFAATSKSVKTLTADREQQLKTAIDHFANTAEQLDRLTSRMDSLRASVQRVAGKVDRGEGSLGKLVNDDKLYTDANESVQSLKALIEDVRKNPKKYLTVKIF